MRRLTLVVVALALAGCDDSTFVDPVQTEVDQASESTMHSNAPFPVWHQGFEQGTGSWLTDDVPGQNGWCGDIAAVQDPSMASAGRSFATVSMGACNAFWQDNGWTASGPAGNGAGLLNPFPEGGYVMELDIYLDPSWTAESVFTLAISLYLLDRPFPYGFRYVMVPVTADEAGLYVAGHSVDDAGWYTFRYRVGSDAGQLALSFELADHGRALFSMSLTSTAYYGDNTSEYAVSNIGNGYFWFVAIADGLDLPIDEHQVRRGR